MPVTGRGRLLGLAALAMVVTFLVLPLLVLVGTAVSDTAYLAFPPQGLTLRWFAQALEDPAWLRSIWESTQIAVVATLLATVVAVPAALGASREGFRGRSLVESMVTLPMLVPQVVLGVGLLQWLLVLGVGRTLTGFVLAHTLLALPFVFRSVAAALVGMPPNLERAAADLGAGPWRRFRHVTLPLLRAGIGAGCLFGFATSYINVEVSMFLAGVALTPLPVKLLNYVAYSVDPIVSAVSTLTVLIAFVAIIIVDRFAGLDRVGAGPG